MLLQSANGQFRFLKAVRGQLYTPYEAFTIDNLTDIQGEPYMTEACDFISIDGRNFIISSPAVSGGSPLTEIPNAPESSEGGPTPKYVRWEIGTVNGQNVDRQVYYAFVDGFLVKYSLTDDTKLAKKLLPFNDPLYPTERSNIAARRGIIGFENRILLWSVYNPRIILPGNPTIDKYEVHLFLDNDGQLEVIDTFTFNDYNRHYYKNLFTSPDLTSIFYFAKNLDREPHMRLRTVDWDAKEVEMVGFDQDDDADLMWMLAKDMEELDEQVKVTDRFFVIRNDDDKRRERNSNNSDSNGTYGSNETNTTREYFESYWYIKDGSIFHIDSRPLVEEELGRAGALNVGTNGTHLLVYNAYEVNDTNSSGDSNSSNY